MFEDAGEIINSQGKDAGKYVHLSVIFLSFCPKKKRHSRINYYQRVPLQRRINWSCLHVKNIHFSSI